MTMATALELFNKFLNKREKNNFAYHQHDIADLRQERADRLDDIGDINQEIATENDTDQLAELCSSRDSYINDLEKMDRVLGFVGEAEQGGLITKVVSTHEWEEQEPVFFSEDLDKVNLAFTFFNAHAVITNE
jgi:hypothetical protein